MPLQDWMKIISVDDHVIEHPHVWQDRLPDKHKQNGPRIIETPEGYQVWRYENEVYPQIGLNAVAGKPPSEYGMDPVRYDQMIPGCYDSHERVKDMDIDGVQAALCFPSFPGFAGGVFQRAQDKELALQCVRAWNDFQVEEWCASAPDRRIPLGILPMWDPVLAAAEVERLSNMGTKAVSLADAPVPLGLPSFHEPTHWEVLWDAVEAADMPLCLTFWWRRLCPGLLVCRYVQARPPCTVCCGNRGLLHQLDVVDSRHRVFGVLLQRHPKLKFMLSEGGIGWIPYIMERLDYSLERHRWYQNISRTDRPSELFRKHFWAVSSMTSTASPRETSSASTTS